MIELSYLDIHTHRSDVSSNAEQVKSLSQDDLLNNRYNAFCSAGIHPWWLEELSREDVERLKNNLRSLAEKGKLWAIGETGLDRLYPEFLDWQKELFVWHLELAREYHLPLIIHSVRAGSDILQLMKEHPPSTPWIFHDYRGNHELTQALLRLHSDCYFSFGISVDNSPQVRDFIKSVPLDHLFLETDAQKHLDIHDIYLRTAELLQVDINFLKSQLWINFKKLTPSLRGDLS